MSLYESTIALLNQWIPPNHYQNTLRHKVLDFLYEHPLGHQRHCTAGHITASTLILTHSAESVLLTLHPKLNRWIQLGGHCEDTDTDIAAAALREAVEESGIANLALDLNLGAIDIYSVICAHGIATRHLDLQFIAYAPADAPIICSKESLDLAWWPIDALPDDTDAGVQRLVSIARHRNAH